MKYCRTFAYLKVAVRWCNQWAADPRLKVVEITDLLTRQTAWTPLDGVQIDYRTLKYGALAEPPAQYRRLQRVA